MSHCMDCALNKPIMLVNAPTAVRHHRELGGCAAGNLLQLPPTGQGDKEQVTCSATIFSVYTHGVHYCTIDTSSPRKMCTWRFSSSRCAWHTLGPHCVESRSLDHNGEYCALCDR